jgi:hypothetical protein
MIRCQYLQVILLVLLIDKKWLQSMGKPEGAF